MGLNQHRRWLYHLNTLGLSRVPPEIETARIGLGDRKRSALRAGFGLVVALLVFSTVSAYRIQSGLSAETTSIYHRHVKQADMLFQLRRTLWLGANAGRDFLLNPHPDRVEHYETTRARLETESTRLFRELKQIEIPSDTAVGLEARIREFWQTLLLMPSTTLPMNAAERFEFVQREIVPRRNAVGDLVRDFTSMSERALAQAEAEIAETRKAAGTRLLIMLGLSLLLAIVVAIYSLVHTESLERETARQYEKIVNARVELQQLSARLMEIQEAERTRLSRELHDEIGQALATLRLELSRAESISVQPADALRERLSNARALAERTIQTIRNISLLLRPSILDDLGLSAALQWLTEDFNRRTGVCCKLSEQWSDGDVLPDTVRTCVYRVLQEALHNCEKHARATLVTVAVSGSPEALTVAVEDNGCGFETTSASNEQPQVRFGLLGMRERAAALGGKVRIDSAPGKGTRITLSLPLRAASAGARAMAGGRA